MEAQKKERLGKGKILEGFIRDIQSRELATTDRACAFTRGVREVVGDSIYITVGIPGGFTELKPTILTAEHMLMMADAGADGLHTHKSCLHDLEELVSLAHSYGLLVDAYIGKSSDRHTFGLSAETPEEVHSVAKQMVNCGADMIGLMSGMSYDGVAAGQLPTELEERLRALTEAVDVPTLAEGGINASNFKAFKKTGVKILVIGTSLDQVAQQAICDTMKIYREGLID